MDITSLIYRPPGTGRFGDSMVPRWKLIPRILRLRRDHGWTQAHLADLLGISQSSVSRMESGQYSAHQMKLSTAAALQKLFEIPIDELFKEIH